jgi:glycosyltransferase involved in cell wall biosynthesis
VKLSIVIPVYNEATTVLDLIGRVESAPLPEDVSRELVIVDDCSTDGTWELLHSLRQKHVVVRHERNQGKGAALRTGFDRAGGDYVLVQDADLEYDPGEYRKLLAPVLMGKAEVVYGSRFAGGEAHRVLYFWHSVANSLLTVFSNALSDLNLTDMETCYKLFSRRVAKRLEIEEKRFGVEPEITAKIARMAREEGIAVYEVGISYHGRTYQEGKKIGLKDAFRAFWCVLKYNTSRLARLIRYGISGILVSISQFVAMVAQVELLGFDTKLLQNVAYAVSIEVSILIGFVLHSIFSWRWRYSAVGEVLRRLLRFHFVTGVSFVVRQALFYGLLEAGLEYRLNTIIGIAVAIVLNFIGYSRFVFRESAQKPGS